MKWYLGVFVFVFVGCGQKKLAEAELKMSEGWHLDEKLVLEFASMDSTKIYDLVVAVRHSRDYSFENVYVKIQNNLPDGTKSDRVVSLELADHTGKWEGDCSGKSCVASITLQESFYFPQKGKYKITVEPYMRMDEIKGIENIRLSVIPRPGSPSH